jgi:hypothetical protein
MREVVGMALMQAVDAAWERPDAAGAGSRFATALAAGVDLTRDRAFVLDLDGLAATARTVVGDVMQSTTADSWQQAFAAAVAADALPVLTRSAPAGGARTDEAVALLLALAANADNAGQLRQRDQTLAVAAGLTLMRRRAVDPERLESLVLAYG